MKITWKMLFDMPFWRLVWLAIQDDIVLFLRLWPLWCVLLIVFIIVIIIIMKD